MNFAVKFQESGQSFDVHFSGVVHFGGSLELPELANPGGAAQLRAGYQLIDGDGKVVDGALPNGSPALSLVLTDESGEVVASVNMEEDAFVSAGTMEQRLQLPLLASDKLTLDKLKVIIPAGFFTNKQITATADVDTVDVAAPAVSVNPDTGLITAEVTQPDGYTPGGTKRTTAQLPAQSAQTITPGTADIVIPAGLYLVGAQTIKGDANLVAENIAEGVSIFGKVGTHKGGTELPTLATPAAEDEVFLGEEFIDGAGAKKTGTFTVEEEVNNLKALTAELLTALEGKTAGGVETCRGSVAL